MTKHITWQDVGISQYFLDILRSLKPGDFLDCAIAMYVFDHNPKLNIKYACSGCGYSKTLQRIHEDYPCCVKCGNSTIYATPLIAYKEFMSYSDGEVEISKIITALHKKYRSYYNVMPDKDSFINFNIDFLNNNSIYTAQFLSGEQVTANSLSFAICKAAILCPFIWDNTYDWKSCSKKEPMKQTHISNLLYLLSTYGVGYDEVQVPQIPDEVLENG